MVRIKAFVEQGGVVVALGPQIPMGRSYERGELFGIDETEATTVHRDVVVENAIGSRVKTASRFRVDSSRSRRSGN